MRRYGLRITVSAAIAIAFAFAVAIAQQATPYKSPPKEIVDILEAPPTPAVSVSPHGRTLLLIHRDDRPDIKVLSQPMYRLGGSRFNPRTNGPSQRGGRTTGFTLMDIESSRERPVEVPSGGDLGRPDWSPDGASFLFTNTVDDGIELWVASVADAKSRRLTAARVNEAAGGCSWMPDSSAALCNLIPEDRGPAPEASPVPSGPTVQETEGGRAAPVRTYQDLLEDAHDADLWEHYMTSRLVLVDVAGGRATPLTPAGIWDEARPSPDGQYFLVEKTMRPFSFLVPSRSFPREVDIIDRRGRTIHELARIPLTDRVPIGGVPTGPRSFRWHPLEDATLIWAEALDEGDPDKDVPHRDRVLRLAAPFSGQPSEVAKTRQRYSGLSFGEEGLVLLNEADRRKRWVWTWRLDGEAPKLIFDRSMQDAYGDPGSPVFKSTSRGTGVIQQQGDVIFLRGQGASPEGDRPFLNRFDLGSGETTTLFRCADDAYETVVEMLDASGSRLLVRHETPEQPPNYFVVSGGDRVALTRFEDPAPQLRGIRKERLTYQRADGVELSATLYLPAAYREGQRLPVVLWAYPREYNSADTASQVRGSLNRFTRMDGTSHMFFLTQGYAILDNPTMPIVGDEGNDSFVEQLVASAQAAVDKIVEMGVADRHRIGVGGHSYGAFMTANLLAHSDLFAAGIARSGAYNRTLTPFGFQNERRTFWQAPEVYFSMSPFMHADQVNEPILLIHGEMDNNSGTFPIQSERYYHALKGHGAKVRYVTLPYESHGYAARESVHHTLWEMISWFDEHVKNAPAPTTDGGK